MKDFIEGEDVKAMSTLKVTITFANIHRDIIDVDGNVIRTEKLLLEEAEDIKSELLEALDRVHEWVNYDPPTEQDGSHPSVNWDQTSAESHLE